MTDEPVLTELADRVLTVTLNRPEKHNALNAAMHSALWDVIGNAGTDDAVGAIVIRGAGRSFCSGADVTPGPDLPNDFELNLRGDIDGMRRGIERWRTLRELGKAVVAQVHGYCLGEGTDLALHCDIVVAADDAQFGYPIVRSLGSPVTHMWTYLAGPQWAKYVLMTGDNVDGATAARIGLALRSVPVDELDEVTHAIAARMASVPLELLAANKAICNKAVDLMGWALLQQLAVENDAIAHKAQAVAEWHEIARRDGLRAAIAHGEQGVS